MTTPLPRGHEASDTTSHFVRRSTRAKRSLWAALESPPASDDESEAYVEKDDEQDYSEDDSEDGKVMSRRSSKRVILYDSDDEGMALLPTFCYVLH